MTNSFGAFKFRTCLAKQNFRKPKSDKHQKDTIFLCSSGKSRKIYEIRAQAGLTQRQLAKMIGTTQSVISRLEDAEYNGHSLDMLERIARALHYKVEIHLIPEAANYAYI